MSDDPVEQALLAAEQFDACLSRFKKLGNEIGLLASGPGGKYLTGNVLEELSEGIQRTMCQISAARPAARCHFCTRKGCERCHQHGWLSAGVHQENRFSAE